jgi:hypothetical protein
MTLKQSHATAQPDNLSMEKNCRKQKSDVRACEHRQISFQSHQSFIAE